MELRPPSAFLILLKLSFLIPSVLNFNINEKSPIVKRSDIPGTYFGFSVAQHETANGKKWILVGSPLGQNLQRNTNHSGALFKCPVTNNAYDCIQVYTDGRRDDFDYEESENAVTYDLPPRPDEIKNNQWLGVTVKSQKPGGNVMVCAHRYIHSTNLAMHHYGLGLCYVLNENLGFEEVLIPCMGKPMALLHEEYGFCQVGASLALLENGVALMGAPGPYTWRGTIFAKEVSGDYVERDKTLYNTPLENQNGVTGKYSYLGMSSTGGKFFSKKRITYVSGAPRSLNNGEVIFFDKESNNKILKVVLKLKGEEFASGFGYEILAVDINNDGYDDLLVGAPFYYADTNAGGAVYIYTNLRNCTLGFECDYTKITRPMEENDRKNAELIEPRFGFAMTSLGDINKDGYNDVAIGAPYEYSGAVYIYLGSKNGLQSTPSQVLRQKHQNRGFRAMGYSLSGGLDMDNNGYPDLLVGAYESDVVMLYKTRPIIDIKIEIDESHMKNVNVSKKGCLQDPYNLNNTCFTFSCCFRIPQDVQKEFKVRYLVEENLKKTKVSRIWFHDHNFSDRTTNSRTLSNILVTQNKRKICQEERIYIKDGIRDILSPIEFKVSYALEGDGDDEPILNKTSSQQFSATFLKDCGGDDVCESKLMLSAGAVATKTSPDEYMLHVGEGEEMQIDANVTNQGDAAYEAKMFIIYPKSLSYISLMADKDKFDPTVCSVHNLTLIICNLGNPLHAKKKARLRMRFEVLKNADPVLNFRIFVNSTSKELSTRTSKSFVAVLNKTAEFTLEGKAITTRLFYGGTGKGESAMRFLEDIGARVKHRYLISNNGHWALQNITVTVNWPHQVASAREQGKWLLYLENIPDFCYLETSKINPLHLNSSGQALEESEPNYIPDEQENEILTQAEITNPEAANLKRQKRDIIESHNVKTQGKNKEIVTMDCRKGAKCVNIICKIEKLSKDELKSIDITSRIWNTTLVEDYSNVDWVVIRSFAHVFIGDSSITKSENSISDAKAETLAYPSNVPVDDSMNLWIIIGSVVIGLVILFIIILILYKYGFFKRNKFDHTQSGSLKKQGEIETESLMGK